MEQDRGRGVGQIHHPVQGGVGEVQSQPDLQLPQEQDVQHAQQNKGSGHSGVAAVEKVIPAEG